MSVQEPGEEMAQIAARLGLDQSAGKPRPWVWYPGIGQETHVEYLQERLAAWGVYNPKKGDPPGFFDRATEAAVRAFQAKRGLRQDAVVSPEVWEELARDPY